jgi:hypothetical protein
MNSQNIAYRIGIYAAITNIAGILLSGPLGLLVVSLVRPAPAWQTPALWAAGYHPVQTLPFYFGFLLLFSYIAIVVVAHRIAEEEHKTYTLIALVFTAAFVPLIFFNYISQTTFLPALARNYRPEYDAIIATFSLNNPNALCWAIEMWGYALLGIATIFAAPVFNRNRTERITAWLMVINGIVSLAGGFVTAVNLSWVLTVPGLVNYLLWNGLVLAMAIFFLLSLRRRLVEGAPEKQTIDRLAPSALPTSNP